MKKNLIDFINFIKNPKDEKYIGKDSYYKWKVLLSLLIAEIIFVLIYFYS